MARSSPRLRRLFDWSAALWAAVVAGALFLALTVLVLPTFVGGNAWVMIRLLASFALGESILAPPATFDLTALIAGLGSHFLYSAVLAILLALVIHRWGLVVGVVGGALYGLALYAINIYALTYFYPWLFVLQGVEFALVNVIFGACAGGVYEWLEVEEMEAL